MKVIVDTCVWSLALRRRADLAQPAVAELGDLVRSGRALLLGLVRQELLSGIRNTVQFAALRDHLRAFPDLPLMAEDYEEAADCFNRCRGQGIQGSTIDFLLCAIALRRDLPIFTVDADFHQYDKVLGLKLHLAGSS